jgi:hypothetical protein
MVIQASSPSESFKESQVIFKEETNVTDAVFSHCRPFNAETEGPAGILFIIDFDDIKYVGVDHPAATHLGAGLPAVFIAPEQVDFGVYLGEREKA